MLVRDALFPLLIMLIVGIWTGIQFERIRWEKQKRREVIKSVRINKKI